MRTLLLAALLLATPALAAAPPPDLATLASRAARRFPQPVRVGDLIGRDVLEPREAQPVLGHVDAIGRRPDGGLDLILQAGGFLGFGTRRVAVPLDAAALLGEHVAILDYAPDQIAALPTVPAHPAPLPPDTVIRMGLTRPFH